MRSRKLSRGLWGWDVTRFCEEERAIMGKLGGLLALPLTVKELTLCPFLRDTHLCDCPKALGGGEGRGQKMVFSTSFLEHRVKSLLEAALR